MLISGKAWAQLSKAEKIKLLEIAVDQNWMGRVFGSVDKEITDQMRRTFDRFRGKKAGNTKGE